MLTADGERLSLRIRPHAAIALRSWRDDSTWPFSRIASLSRLLSDHCASPQPDPPARCLRCHPTEQKLLERSLPCSPRSPPPVPWSTYRTDLASRELRCRCGLR